MKKLITILLVSIFLVAGCDNTMNTPTSKVEEFLSKYQNLDSKVLKELDGILKKDENMSADQSKEYKILLEKQYQNLSYKIKNEQVEGDSATVDVEIEVLDYQTAITKAKEYYSEHQDEFKDSNKDKQEDNQESDTEDANKSDNLKDKVEDVKDKVTDNLDDLGEKAEDAKDKIMENIDHVSSFIDYKIKELKNVNNKIKYDLTFNLTKENGKWVIDDLTNEDREKLHGLY